MGVFMTDMDSEEYYMPETHRAVIAGYRLICTCPMCPEQYDVFDAQTDAQVGYLRLRHGFFRADLGGHGGETVYESNTKGDGSFEADERLPEITAAIRALKAARK